MLNSVLLAVRCQIHLSTGYSPITMMFNKDPILIFIQADETEQGSDTSNKDNSFYGNTDEIMSHIDQIEANRQKIFNLANTNIKNAQVKQCKSYNKRHATGISSE